jgi:hypothetical protein
MNSGPTLLNIFQSGPNVFLAFDDIQKTTLVGSVQDRTIDANVLGDQRGAATTKIHFHGRVDRQTEPDRLVGLLIFGDGPSRTEVPLSAVRQGEVRKPSGGE